MSPPVCEKPQEPHTAEQERSQQVGQASLVTDRPEIRESDHGGSDRKPPDPPPTDHDRSGRGDRPERPPLWRELEIFAILLVLIGAFIGLVGNAMRAREERGGA